MLVTSAVGVTALAAVAAIWLLGLKGDSASEQAAPRDVAPVLVPRRRRPQVVEPVAGEVGGGRTDRALPAEAAPAASEKAPPGPAAGVPSDAEVRRQLTRMESARRRYNFDQLDFSGELLPWGSLPTDGWRTSVASVYFDYGGGLACGGTLQVEQLGVAHKSAPCGTMVTFRYGRRAIRVPVIDRGPYIAGREWDFTGATAAALGFPGLGPVQWHT